MFDELVEVNTLKMIIDFKSLMLNTLWTKIEEKAIIINQRRSRTSRFLC